MRTVVKEMGQQCLGANSCCHFEVVIAGPSPGAVLADQVKSLDWRKSWAKRKGIISAAELAEVRAKIRALIG